MSQVRLLLADEQAVCLAALQSLLAKEFNVVGAVSTTSELMAEVERLKPQVVLARIPNQDQEVLRAVKVIRGKYPGTRFVVLAAERGKQVCEKALSSGASACLHATEKPEKLIRTIQEIAMEGSVASTVGKTSELPLTARQREILSMIIAGLPQKEIGARLHVSPKTVEFHKYRMMRQLGVKSSAELIVAAVRQGLTSDREE